MAASDGQHVAASLGQCAAVRWQLGAVEWGVQAAIMRQHMVAMLPAPSPHGPIGCLSS